MYGSADATPFGGHADARFVGWFVSFISALDNGLPKTNTDRAACQGATALPWGGGDKCPIGTAQVIRVTWDGGITKPGGKPADLEEGQLYNVQVASEDGARRTTTAAALADLNKGGNNHLLCLNTTDRVQSVSFPAGYLTDPREGLNRDIEISVLNRATGPTQKQKEEAQS